MNIFRNRNGKSQAAEFSADGEQVSAIEPETRPVPLTFQTQDGSFSQTFPQEVVEALRLAVSRLLMNNTLPRRLTITSALSQEGVTYLSRGMATVLANDMNASVCVVELNWWRPEKYLNMQYEHNGLAGVLTGEATLENAIVLTDRPNLSILPAGHMDVVSRPVMARSKILKDTIESLNAQWEYVILDVPAVLATNDAIPLAGLGDACCLIVNQGITSIDNVRVTLDEIAQYKILGIMLNRVKIVTPPAILSLIPQDPVSQTYGLSR